jgi:hypothetical protein
MMCFLTWRRNSRKSMMPIIIDLQSGMAARQGIEEAVDVKVAEKVIRPAA